MTHMRLLLDEFPTAEYLHIRAPIKQKVVLMYNDGSINQSINKSINKLINTINQSINQLAICSLFVCLWFVVNCWGVLIADCEGQPHYGL